jgi:predicted P-loop ATPase
METTLFSRITQSKNGQYLAVDEILRKIKNGEWQDIALKIMAEGNKEVRNELKKAVPYFTPSGKFEQRKANGLIAHSGLIGIDIDEVENIEAVAQILRADEHTYSVFKSISGRGLCVLVRVEPDKHKDAFEALAKYYFEILRHPVDPSCKDVSRARFVSYDPDLYVNHSAKVFKKYLPKKETNTVRPLNFIHTKTKFEKVLERINCDITGGYHQWRDIGFAIAAEFGEAGRGYYHHISSYSPTYDQKTTDKQYSYCCRPYAGGIKIGTFYHYAKQSGVDVTDQNESMVAKIAYFAKEGGRNIDSVRKIIDMKGLEQNDEVVEAVFQSKDFNPTVNENGKSDLNIEEVELWLSSNYNIQKNEITRAYELDLKPLETEDFNSIFIAAKKTFDKLSRELFDTIIFSNFTPKYNPVRDYFNRIGWDGKDRIDDLCKSITSTTGTFEFRKRMLTKWLLGIIEPVYISEPNILMLVLAGKKQGTGKSWFFRNLLPKPLKNYFAVSQLDQGKDDYILLTQKLLILDDEYSGKSKKDSKQLKYILSANQFDLREPYGKKNVTLQKIATMAGTSNDIQILNDPTGNRRIIVFEVTDRCKFDLYNTIDKEQLFAQVVALHERGERSLLLESDIDALARYTGGEFEESCVEKELLLEFYAPALADDYSRIFLTTTQIKVRLEIHTHQRLNINRLGMELKAAGFERQKIKGSYGYYVQDLKGQGVTLNQPPQDPF